MKKIYLLGAALVMLASVSCDKNSGTQPSAEKGEMTFSATSKGAVKTTVTGGTTVVWSSGDDIKVFAPDDTKGGVCGIIKGAGTSEAEFKGVCSFKGPWTAICPSAVVAEIGMGYSSGEITFVVPSTQVYAGNTFAKGAMPCVAYANETNLEFNHVFGVLKLQLKGTGSIESITLVDKNGFKLNGTFNVNPSVTAAATKVEGNGSAAILLTCGTGVELNTSTATEFWFVVPQGAFAGGLDANIVLTDKNTKTLSTTKKVNITAGVITPMAEITIDNPVPPVKDDCGYTYPVVKIGDQYWMAENLHCDKYSTNSSIEEGMSKQLSPSESDKFDAYYTDGMTHASGNFGYYYNWAAAVGVKDGSTVPAGYSAVNRQGICMDGWHLPSQAEWKALKDYINGGDPGTQTAGIHLKANVMTWEGTHDHCDTYGFAGLPAGFSNGSKDGKATTASVGCYAYFWAADSNGAKPAVGSHSTLGFDNDDQIVSNSLEKEFGYSVRCVKNATTK